MKKEEKQTQKQPKVDRLSVEEAEKLIQENKDNPDFSILDVRTSMERCISHIPNSQHLSYFDIEDRLNELKKDKTYLVYCRSGHRSLNSATIMAKNGYKGISMNGGMNAWRQDTESSCNLI